MGRYRVDVGSFEALALPALAPQPGTRLLVIDEVGERRPLVQPGQGAPCCRKLQDAAAGRAGGCAWG